MTVTEKTAYLRGLMDGLKIDKASDEGRLFDAIIDTLESLALSVADIEEGNEIVNQELDMIEDALDSVDEELELIDEDLDTLFDALDCDCDCCDCDDDDDDECCCGCDDDEEYYELVCPTCGEEIVLDEEMIGAGGMKCPACGEDLEFDLSGLEEAEAGE